MARTKSVTFGGRKIRVEERRIGELEKLIADLFPESGGDVSKIELDKLLGQFGFGLLYEKIPVIFPDITAEDVKNAYPSELEALVEAFIEVNFTGLKRLLAPILTFAQAGLTPRSS
ncbi:MAG: hypothetical protein DIU60_020510 [Actinomycetes bacterium]